MRQATPEELCRLFVLNINTGVLVWRARTPDMFNAKRYGNERACRIWNTRYAGKKALNTANGYGYVYGYVYGSIFGRGHLAHRVVWAMVHGEWPDEVATIAFSE